MDVGSHARNSARGSWSLPVLAVLAVVGGVGIAWLSSPSATTDDCPEDVTIRLAADPAMAGVLTRAAEELTGCLRVEVAATPSAEVLPAFVQDQSPPDLWVPDTPVRISQLAAGGVAVDVLAESVASSPVVLVGGPAADAPVSWFAALSSGRVAMSNPLVDAAGALALVAPRAEQDLSGATPAEIRARIVPVAQQYGERAAAGKGADDVLATISATSQVLVPVTEQAYLTARRDNPSLTPVSPKTGSPVVRLPLVAAPGADVEVREAGEQLVALLSGERGSTLLSQAFWRGADAAPLGGGVGVGEVAELAPPAAEEVLMDLRVWEVLTVPSSILAVLDASGSMDFDARGGTRIELAADAARTALGAFPGNARVGLWLFSIDQGGDGVDHREMVPLGRLDEKRGGATQREALGAAIGQALGLTRGGTGLYDTTLAAFRTAQEAYDPAYFNSVVILTDGANDDPGSIKLDDLLDRLRSEADPQRPVRIIAIGISEDADMEALTQIAEATNGSAYPARDPRDILPVISRALLAR